MSCKACGGTAFDANGACTTCGLPNDASADTQPNGDALANGAVPVATVAAAAPPAPPTRATDPAATNPGSGVFCGRCGSAVAPDGDFCGICGNPLKETALAHLREERGIGVGGGLAVLAKSDVALPLAPVHSSPKAPQWSVLALVLVGVVLLGLTFGLLIVHGH